MVPSPPSHSYNHQMHRCKNTSTLLTLCDCGECTGVQVAIEKQMSVMAKREITERQRDLAKIPRAQGFSFFLKQRNMPLTESKQIILELLREDESNWQHVESLTTKSEVKSVERARKRFTGVQVLQAFDKASIRILDRRQQNALASLRYHCN